MAALTIIAKLQAKLGVDEQLYEACRRIHAAGSKSNQSNHFYHATWTR